MTEAEDAILGSALRAPHDSRLAFNDGLPMQADFLRFMLHALAHDTVIACDRTRCMIDSDYRGWPHLGPRPSTLGVTYKTAFITFS